MADQLGTRGRTSFDSDATVVTAILLNRHINSRGQRLGHDGVVANNHRPGLQIRDISLRRGSGVPRGECRAHLIT
jgi:hypothetical protein